MTNLSHIAQKCRDSILAVGLAFILAQGFAGGAPPRPATVPVKPSTPLILGNTSFWRCAFVKRKPVVRVGQDLKPLWFEAWGDVWVTEDRAKDLSPTVETPAPPANWADADFDDQSWGHMAGPFFATEHGWAYTKEADGAGFFGYEGTSADLATICVRGKFQVADPAAAGDMKLSLTYRGGAVVYLNGREIARGSIPDAEKAKGIEALAEDYPQEAFVKEDGRMIGHMAEPAKYADRIQKRMRKLDAVVIPAALLRKGVNVLAIEAHRSAYHAALQGAGARPGTKGYALNWCTVGVTRIELTGAAPGVTPNVARPAGVQVWNQETIVRPKVTDFGDPCEPLRLIRLIAAPNGTFSGEVVVGSTAPLHGLKAAATGLSGPGVVPASAVQVRYALVDADSGNFGEVLSADAPAEVAVDKAGGGAMQPVWVTAKVPADARSGDYKGKLTIALDGTAPIEAAIELHVVGWAMPDTKSFLGHVGLTESPETVAMRYKVPMWSPEHWKLLDATFALLGEAGAKDIFITAIRHTHHGNEDAMVRFIKQPDSSYLPDLRIAEKYLDTAIAHLGKVPVVCLYCWEPFTGGQYGGKPWPNKAIPFTVVDPATGQLSAAEGPEWGQPEMRTFWKPVFDGMREILKKRGTEGSLMVGVGGDSLPKKDAVDDIKAIAPDVKWVVQCHGSPRSVAGQPVGYLADVWNAPSAPDPSQKRLYGWQDPFLRTTFPRFGSNTVKDIHTNSPLVQYRIALEGMSAAGIHGFGRVGADFWNVLATPNKTYGNGRNLIARYPESDWAQLYLGNATPYVIVPGPLGPLATARFEMLRMGAQDLEARIFLEKALLDPAAKAKLGDDLADRCQKLLDERVRAINVAKTDWMFFTGAEGRLEKLYDLAGEVARREAAR